MAAHASVLTPQIFVRQVKVGISERRVGSALTPPFLHVTHACHLRVVGICSFSMRPHDAYIIERYLGKCAHVSVASGASATIKNAVCVV